MIKLKMGEIVTLYPEENIEVKCEVIKDKGNGIYTLSAYFDNGEELVFDYQLLKEH